MLMTCRLCQYGWDTRSDALGGDDELKCEQDAPVIRDDCGDVPPTLNPFFHVAWLANFDVNLRPKLKNWTVPLDIWLITMIVPIYSVALAAVAVSCLVVMFRLSKLVQSIQPALTPLSIANVRMLLL
jgi:hypothetical protein